MRKTKRTLRMLRNLAPRAADLYAVDGFSPELVVDAAGVLNSGTEFFRSGGSTTTYTSLFGTAFDRSGVATMVDSSGNLKWSAHNQVSNSKSKSSGWTTQNASIGGGSVTGPLGDTVSNVLVIPAATSSSAHRTIVSSATPFTNPGQMTLVFFAKAGGYSRVGYTNGAGSDYASFLLSGAGSVLDSANVVSTSITSLSDDWYVCTVVTSQASIRADMQPLDDSYTTGDPSGYTYTGDGSSGVYLVDEHLYNSSLGGMVDVYSDEQESSSYPKYLATTGSARYLLRRQAYAPISGTMTLKGFQIEEARTNLDPNSDDLSAWTTSNTSIAKDQTGAGGNANEAHSITASANNGTALEQITASSADHVWSCLMKRITGSGTVEVTVDGGTSWVDVTSDLSTSIFVQVGTGAGATVTNPEFGVRLGTSGDVVAVQNSQLEQTSGQFSSPIPTTGATATRAADVTTDQLVAAKLPYSATAMSIAYEALMSYADGAKAYQIRPVEWRLDGNNLIQSYIDTNGTRTGQVRGITESGGVLDLVTASPDYTPGINVAMKAAMRVAAESSGGAGDGEVQVAKDGSSGTANTTVGTLPDLSATNLDFFDTGGNGFVSLFRMWGADIGQTGIESAST